MSEQAVEVNFAEIRNLMKEMPGPDLEAETAVRSRLLSQKLAGSDYQQLTDFYAWLARWQGEAFPKIDRPRIAIFAANHGIATEEGVVNAALSQTQESVDALVNGDSPTYRMAEKIDADLRVYEMDLATPTQHIQQAPAMTEEECAKAMTYGMMAVEQNVQLLAIGEVGAGSELSAAAICLALFGGKPEEWLPNTGLSSRYAKQLSLVVDAVEKHRDLKETAEAFDVLAALGGFQFAAICGTVLAARLARIPVLLEGFTALAAASILTFYDKDFLDHCLISGETIDTAQQKLMAELGKTTLETTLKTTSKEALASTFAIEKMQSSLFCLNL